MPRRKLRRIPPRQNARRTWPDGSGCEQRPIHPHIDGCRGWEWDLTGYGGKPPSAPQVAIYRCEQCRTFDDDEEASEHVRGCATCTDEVRSEIDAMEARKRRRLRDDQGSMPSIRQRLALIDWFEELIGRDTGLWEGSSTYTISTFLEDIGAGIFDFPNSATAWHKLRRYAGEEYDGTPDGWPDWRDYSAAPTDDDPPSDDEEAEPLVPMPSRARRKKWSSWANRVSSGPRLDPDSDYEAVTGWLEDNDPNGDYGSEDADALPRAWETLGEICTSYEEGEDGDP